MDTTIRKDFPTIFKELAAAMDTPDMALDDNGDYALLINPDLIVNLHYDNEINQLLIFALIADIDGIPDREEFLVSAMRSNYFWEENNSFTIALEQEADNVVLFGKRRGDLFASHDELSKYIDVFIETVFHWRQNIADTYMQPILDQSPDALQDEDEDEDGDEA